MAKRKSAVRFRIPPYVIPRNRWRRLIYDAAQRKLATQRVIYLPDDKLEIVIVLYFDRSPLRFHDIDNRLKDVLDALQGRMGGPKAVRLHKPLIPNDNQIFRVTVTKMRTPKQSKDNGYAKILRLGGNRDYID